MKTIVFDTGPVISFAMNNMLWILDPLKKTFNGDFVITPGVHKELIEVPLNTKKFKFEAMQIMQYIKKGTIEIVDNNMIRKDTLKLMELANKIFKSKGNWIKIVHYGEIEAVAAAINFEAHALVIDERTTRTLLEDPARLKHTMERKLHGKIFVNNTALKEFKKMTKGIRVIRSTEMAVMAFEMGLLDKFLPDLPKPRKELLESVLWAFKLNGCAISQNEIDSVVKAETS